MVWFHVECLPCVG